MTSQAAVQLFCFPYAGASASCYARWRRQLPAWIELVPVELAGHGWRFSEPLESTMPRVIAQIESQVQPRNGRPFALFGHSLGALVAFEMARQLERRGAGAPVALFASGCEAPRAPERRGVSLDLSDDGLIAELRRLDGTPAPALASPELMQLTLPILRADFRVAASYRGHARGVIRAPIHVLAGTTDNLDDARVSDWSAHTLSTCVVRRYEGGHFFIHDREPEVLATLMQELAPHRRWVRSAGAHEVRAPNGLKRRASAVYRGTARPRTSST